MDSEIFSYSFFSLKTQHRAPSQCNRKKSIFVLICSALIRSINQKTQKTLLHYYYCHLQNFHKRKLMQLTKTTFSPNETRRKSREIFKDQKCPLFCHLKEKRKNFLLFFGLTIGCPHKIISLKKKHENSSSISCPDFSFFPFS